MTPTGIQVRFPRLLTVRLWAGALWRLALTALLLTLTWQTYGLRNLPEWIERQIRRESDATRGVAIAAIGDVRKDVIGQVISLRKDVMSRVDTSLTIADTHLGNLDSHMVEVAGSWDKQLTRTADSFTAVAATAAGIAPVLEHAGSVAKRVDDAAPFFLDCDHNPDCVFNRYVGASKGIETAARNFSLMSADVRTAVPVGLTTFQSIGNNVNSSTASIDRMLKPHWYDRVLGYAVNGAVLYRNLNPVTNLTLTGAQIVSSRP